MYGFMREHLRFILIYIVNLVMISLIVYLDLMGQHAAVSGSNIFYFCLLSLILLGIFLGYSYQKQKNNYKSLSLPIDSLEEPLTRFESSSYLFSEFKELLQKQYFLFSREHSKLAEGKQQYNTFINQWVHQMKTPLSVMSLLLQSSESSQDIPLHFRRSLEEEIEKMHTGLELVIHSARLDAFEEDFKAESIELSSLVSMCISEHKKAFIRHAVYPKMNIPNGLVIETDRKWLSFAINQIISNSIKYSRGTSQTVDFFSEQYGKTLTLSIRDYGIGIPQQDVKRVFQPFFTGTNGRISSESTGMGLYLAKKICDNIGHELSIHSEQGKGSTFSITFFNVTKL